MKYYDYLLKSPLLLAVIALISWCFIGVDIYRQIPIFCIIGLFFTFKNKEIMTQGFKLEFALYFAGLFALRNLIVLFWGMHDPWGAASIITSLPFIIIALPAQALIAFIGAYLSLLVSNRIFYMFIKIAEFKNWTRYIARPFIFLVEQPKYIVIGLISILFIHFTYTSFFYEKGNFKKVGILDKNSTDISNIIPLSNGNVFLLCASKQYNIYDIKTKKITFGGFLKQRYMGIHNPKALMLDNGKILIIGELTRPKGETYATPHVTYGELYDPKTDKIELTVQNPLPTFSFSMTKLLDGRVLITGGAGNSKKVQIYNPQTNKFSQAGDLKQGRYGHSTIVLRNGNVLIIGGSTDTGEVYDTKQLKVIHTFPFKTYSWGKEGKMISLDDGRILIYCKKNYSSKELSGDGSKMTSLNSKTHKYDTAYPGSYLGIYDPTTQKIQDLKLDSKNKIQDFDIAKLKDGRILITGGKIGRGKRRGYSVLNAAEIFDPKTNKITPLKNKMNAPRYDHDSVTLANGDILILSGVSNKQFRVKEIELFSTPKQH